jgi:predicted nucleic acid-binding protein
MPLSNIDFGKSIIPLTGRDAFFLDTNMLVAYMYDKHDKHLPCFGLISYLIRNEVVICTSEIVIVELINSLARVLYIDDRLTAYMEENDELGNIKKQERIFKGDWSNKVQKTEPEMGICASRMS